ncbi:hypothetical protein [Metabacillus fastidiosus]|uniref:hypothetical protein n=1 Tax=Metabacillus fastidiosus TaxID=1458 RepID=UPI0008250B0E|nr:hypothetical protein [Metabacillus fastidiosus]MED4461086.1 hypothetical protein [Metabacillus fastidiosus]
MITYSDTAFVKAPASEIINWFLEMDEEQYMNWHKDHKAFRLVNETKGVGRTCYSEEYLGSFLLKATYKLTVLFENRFLIFELGFPFSLLKGTCHFKLEEQADGTVMTALITLGGKFDLFDPFIQKIMNKFLFKDESLLSHTKEEREYINELFAERNTNSINS